MRKADIVVSLLFMLLGIIVIADSVRLGFMWGRTGPESGFFPFLFGGGYGHILRDRLFQRLYPI